MKPSKAEIHDTLVKARETLAQPENWAKGWYSFQRNEGLADVRVYPWQESANCFCSMGAVLKNTKGYNSLCPTTEVSMRYLAAEDTLEEHLPAGWMAVPHFNDAPQTTHVEVLALFDRAIKATE